MNASADPRGTYIGTRWDAKSADRTITILSEASPWRGDRMFLVQTISTGRTRLLSLPGLLRKYKRVGGGA